MHFQRVLHIYVGWEQCFLNYYIAMSMWEKWQETHIVSPHESTEAIKIVLIRRQEKIGEQMSCHLTYSKRLPGGTFTRTLRYPGESPRHGCFAVIFYHGHCIDFRTRGVLTATFSVDWCPLWRHQWNLFRSSPRRIYQSFFFLEKLINSAAISTTDIYGVLVIYVQTYAEYVPKFTPVWVKRRLGHENSV